MNTEKHTVTIPIADYNELVKAQEFSGLTKITPESPNGRMIQQSFEMMARSENFIGGVGDIFETLDFYFKKKTK